MSYGHSNESGARITYGQLSLLEPFDSHDAEVHQHRDAQLKLDAVPAEKVIAVRPTSFSSGMLLGNAALTVIVIHTLPRDIRDSLAEKTGLDVDEFKLLRIGRADREYTDRSLAEYSE